MSSLPGDVDVVLCAECGSSYDDPRHREENWSIAAGGGHPFDEPEPVAPRPRVAVQPKQVAPMVALLAEAPAAVVTVSHRPVAVAKLGTVEPRRVLEGRRIRPTVPRKDRRREAIERQCTCGKTFVAPHAKTCPDCRYDLKNRKRPTARKYDWTPERDQILRDRYDSRVRNRAREIASEFGWPKWVITHRAAAIGLSFTRAALGIKEWTAEEEAFLGRHVGRRTTLWMARQLKRGETSVIMKLKNMKLSRRVRVGYRLHDLMLAFGVDHKTISQWVHGGKLHVEKRGTGRVGHRPGDIWMARDENVLRFVLQYPNDFELRKVDQTWFLALIGIGAEDGLLQRALKAHESSRRDDEPPSPPVQLRDRKRGEK